MDGYKRFEDYKDETSKSLEKLKFDEDESYLYSFVKPVVEFF